MGRFAGISLFHELKLPSELVLNPLGSDAV